LTVNDDLLPAIHNTPSYLANNNNWTSQSYEIIIMNEAKKLYDKLSKNMVEEILDQYDVGISQSSLPLL